MSKTIVCEPNVVNFTKSFKNIGYNHYSAILDLIDNSISAGASKIWVDYKKNNNNSYNCFINDNGSGMNKNELIEAMRIASSNPNLARAENELGKFGLGLKLASFSQTDKFTVISKKSDDVKCSCTWDLDFVRKSKKWLLIEENDLDFFRPKNQGTEIILYDLFKNREINEDEVYSRLRTHIATAYIQLRGMKFYINDKEIKKIDPFFSKNLASNHSSIDTIYIDKIPIKVQSHQIPHSNKLNSQEKKKFYELSEIGMGHGIYVFRKKRLIAWTGWEGLGKNLRINDLYRLAINCDEDADSLFNIEVKKSQISITDTQLRSRLKNSIVNFSEIARKPYQKRAKLSLKDVSDIWDLERSDQGKVIFTINRKSESIRLFKDNKINLTELLNILESTIPYSSLLYYLNLNKVDNLIVGKKKIEAAEILFNNGLLSHMELKKIKDKYGS